MNNIEIANSFANYIKTNYKALKVLVDTANHTKIRTALLDSLNSTDKANTEVIVSKFTAKAAYPASISRSNIYFSDKILFSISADLLNIYVCSSIDLRGYVKKHPATLPKGQSYIKGGDIESIFLSPDLRGKAFKVQVKL